MTVPASPRKAGPFSGNGSTTEFPFEFKVFTDADVRVVVADAFGVERVLELDSDYTVELNPDQDATPGGTITVLGSPLASAEVISIVGALEYSQETDLPAGGNFNPTVLENALDKLSMQIQQVQEEASRAAKIPVTRPEAAEELVDLLFAVAANAQAIATVLDNMPSIQKVADDLNEPVSEIDTVAGAIDNINAVGNNIANVNAVAGNASNINTTVANLTAIQDAPNQAAAAAASAAAAAASFDSFDDRYLGPKSTDPSLDNDGNTLLVGALYFNTTAGEMRVWDGSAWEPAAAVASAVTEHAFTATAGQSSFTFPSGYRVGVLYVWVNGVLLSGSDITATDGITVTFASPLSLDDEVRAVTFKALGSVTYTDIGVPQASVPASNINVSSASYFTKTITANTTFTVSNIPASGQAASFVLEITNGGAFTVNFWANIRWPGGAAPLLTASGTDVLGFYTFNGGSTWRGFMLARDSK